MGLPPPPLLRDHHQRLRYGNFLHPPYFIPSPYTHHLPPPPPPQARQPLILLAPPTPPPRHADHPPPSRGLNFFQSRQPILDRSHPYEVGLLPKPYIHDYSDPKPILRSASYAHVLAESRDRQLHSGAMELHSRVPDIGDRKRYRDNFCPGMIMDYDETRRSSINGWIHGLYKDKGFEGDDDDDRTSNHGTNDAVLSRSSDRLGSRISKGELVTSKKKRRLQKELSTNRIQSREDSSGGSFKGKGNKGSECLRTRRDCMRGREERKGELVTSKKKKRRQQKDIATNRIQSREDSSEGSFKGKENKGSECLQTRMNCKRESGESRDLAVSFKSNTLMGPAILPPHCPAVKTDIKSMIVKTGITSSTPCSPMAKSDEDVVKTDRLACALSPQSDSLGTSKELLDKSAASVNGSGECNANDESEIAVKIQPQKDVNLQGRTVIKSGKTRRDRSRRKRKARKKLLHETNMKMRKDSIGITSPNDCVVPSAPPQPCPDTNGLGEVAVKNHPQKNMNSEGPTVIGSGSTCRKKGKARKKLLVDTGMQIRKDSGHSISANDCIVSLASPLPCSGEIAVKDQPQKDMDLDGSTVVGSGSTCRKKRKARKKVLLDTSVQMREDSDHSINANSCIIPLVSQQPCSDVNDLGEIAVKNQLQEDMYIEDPTVGSGRACQKKGKSRKQSYYGNILKMRRDKDHIICITPSASNSLKMRRKDHIICITPSASHQPSSDTTLAETDLSAAFIGAVPDAVSEPTFGALVAEKADSSGDSCKLLVPNLKRKRSSLTTLSVSSYVADNVIPECSGHAERSVTSVEDVEAERCAHDTSLASESMVLVDSSGFNQHGSNVDKIVQNDVSEFDAEKSIIEPVDQYAKLGTDRVDDTSEHFFPDGLPLMENPSVNEPPRFMVPLEGNDVPGSSQEDIYFSEILALNTASESDSALPLKPGNVKISSVGSADANSKEVFLNEVNIPQVVVDSKESRSSIGDIGSVEASLEAISNAKTCLSVDYSSNLTRKGKAQGPQSCISGTNVAFDTTISDEVGKLLVKDLVPSMGIDFLGEKGSFKEDDKSNEGPSRVEDSTLELDLDADGLFPSHSKKRKVGSPRQREDSSFSENTMPSACQSETEMIFVGENKSNSKPVSPDLNLFPSGKSLEKAASVNSQINAELSRSLPEAKNELVKNLNIAYGNQTSSKNQWTSASPKVFPARHPLYFSNSRNLQPTHVAKPRTWHRNDHSSGAVAEIKLQPTMLPHSQGAKTARTIQSSYIRKGNSLVRNPSPSAVSSGLHNSSCSVYRLHPCTDKMKNNQASDADAQCIIRKEQVNTSEMPNKTISALKEHIKSPGVSECRADLGSSSSSRSTLKEGNPEKKIMYVKRRSNQLIAASNSDDISTLGVDKSKASSDGYYKKKKNQLVRGSSENHVKEKDSNGNSRRLVSRTIFPRTCTRRSSGISKHLKFSSVWKLHDIQSLGTHKTSVGPQKVLPHLFPWKRARNWRTFMHALNTKPKVKKSPLKSPFCIDSQSLLLSRKRGAVYTRSTHGYSLRMSKVLSLGGSSLKWSKSIERSSKKASEEATRAVAAAEKRKKEENGAVPIASKSRNNVSRERIFRIGSERYKMDPTRRTLHRITVEKETSSSVVLQTEKNVKRSYVPRRLLIGNEEYVRIGNGNQLVRDPKKRTRVLASEKVRWSLRTARLRLARKRKYCQFFTRFGKCNKDDGKCQFIHDPSKIAVCTKFLNGLCTNVDCKLTHKVIPERMEDCSYFLKGSCSNETCPYRHVIVNPKSAVCKNFLKGYCADGNECRKKHTYVCPAFEATGLCPKASTCKLHHPKKKITEKKQPTSEPNTIVRGRYFDGGLTGDADVSDTSTEKISAKGMDDVGGSHGGKFPDYISLDVSDDERDQTLTSDEDCEVDDNDYDFDVLV